jgi:hypothetical protein
MAYVYRHIRLDKNEPFYIGIGSDSTFKRAKSKYKLDRNEIWHKIVSKTKYEIEILFDNVDWDFACKKEKELIALYGRKKINTGILSNITEGGEGVSGFPMKRTLESIEKQRKTMKDKYKNDSAFKEMHINYLKEGVKKRKYGKESDEIRKKKSESHKARYKNGFIPYFKGKTGSESSHSIKVFCLETKKVWVSIIECAQEIGITKTYLARMLRGERKNKTNIRYYYGNN